MLSPRYEASAVLLGDNTIMVSGGKNGGWGQRSTELYDGDVWKAGKDLPTGIYSHCTVFLPDSGVFLVGGYIGASIAVPDTYGYDESTGLWVKKASMAIPRSYHACSAYNGEIWVGGTSHSFDDADTIEVYNVDRDEWRAGPQLPYQAHIYPGEFVSHGKLLLYVGGNGEKGIHQLKEEKDGWIYVSNYLYYSAHSDSAPSDSSSH
jgi:hypothetical protein